MAVQMNNGMWRANDGSTHHYESDADKADGGVFNKDHSDGGFAGQAGGGAMYIVMIVFLIGPIIAGKVLGWIFGALSHLGTVGKVLQTAVMVIVGFFYGLFLGGALQMWLPFVKILDAPLMFGIAVLAAVWFWLWHSDAVKLMGAGEFSRYIKNACIFIWFGAIGGGLIGWLIGVDNMFYISLSITLVGGLVYYLIKSKPFTQEAKEMTEPETVAKKKKIWRIALIAIAVLCAVLLTINLIGVGVNAAYETKIENMTDDIRKNPAGHTVFIQSASYEDGVSLYTEASPTSKVVKTVPYDGSYKETGILTGEVSGLWAQVDYKGTKGWVYTPFLRLIINYKDKDEKMSFFDNYPYQGTISATIKNAIEPGYADRPVTIEKGTEVTIIKAGEIKLKDKYYLLKNNNFESVIPVDKTISISGGNNK